MNFHEFGKMLLKPEVLPYLHPPIVKWGADIYSRIRTDLVCARARVISGGYIGDDMSPNTRYRSRERTPTREIITRLSRKTSRATVTDVAQYSEGTHALSCSIGGLVIARHKKIHDELLYLSRRAFTSESVSAQTPNTSGTYHIRARDTSG